MLEGLWCGWGWVVCLVMRVATPIDLPQVVLEDVSAWVVEGVRCCWLRLTRCCLLLLAEQQCLLGSGHSPTIQHKTGEQLAPCV